MCLKDFAKSLPHPVKQGLYYVYGSTPPRFRYGKVFCDTYDFLQKSQWWSEEKLEKYQFSKLKELLNFCSKYVPFYQGRWSDYGININDVHDFSDFARLPFTTKEDIIRSGGLMIPRVYNKDRLILTHTGGSTDSKAFFYVTKDAIQKEKAFFARYWKWHNYNFMKDDCVIFRGSLQKSSRIIKKFGNYHIFSSFDVTTKRLKTYIEYIAKNKIPYVQGYPSFVYQLFKFAYENGLVSELTCINCVFCASEKLYNYQKDFIEKKFNVKAYDHYGHLESLACFQQCEYNDSYHTISEYGYTEFDSVTNSNDLFEIICTGFNNLATPLIRYKTKDYAKLQKDVDCACGLKYPKTVREIEGRSGDVIVTPKGKIIGPSHLEFAERGTQSFNDWQIIQDNPNHLTLLIVPSPSYAENDEKLFRERLFSRLDEKMGMDLQIVDKIKRPASQKKRLIISKLETQGSA